LLFALVEALLRYLACMACLAAAMLFGSWTYKSASLIAASGRLNEELAGDAIREVGATPAWERNAA
jgi:hypothetical protein